MKVLAIVPTHDRLEFLDAALNSLVAQTRPADEVIVIGNVMTPTSYPNITYMASDASLATRLNATIDASDCDAYMILSDDDTVLPLFIEKTVGVMKSTGADIVWTEFDTIPVTALFRKSIWKKTGGYCDIGFWDWDFKWSCGTANAYNVHLAEHLFQYNQHPAQVAQHALWRADGTWDAWTAAIYAKHSK